MFKLIDGLIIASCKECKKGIGTDRSMWCDLLKKEVDPNQIHLDCPLKDCVVTKNFLPSPNYVETINLHYNDDIKDIEKIIIVKKRRFKK
jgi:hypothetical protein